MALASTRGVTRWRRSALVALPAGVAVAGMTAALLQGVMAANLSVSSADMQLTADQVTANNGLALVAHPTTRTCTSAMQSAGTNGCSSTVTTYQVANAEAGIPSASLDNLCVSAPVSVLGTTYNVKIGIPGTGTTAQNLLLGADSLNATSSSTLGGSTTSPIALGVSANDASVAADGITDGAAGEFGLSANGGASTLGSLNANAQQATIGGSLTAGNGLNIAVGSGTGSACS